MHAIEHHFQCPWCWETISMLLDTSGGAQSYIEDCEVCCNPIAIDFLTDGDWIEGFSAERAQ